MTPDGGRPILNLPVNYGKSARIGVESCSGPNESSKTWVGACPGDDESAGVNYNHRSPKGNRHMRRILNQAANAAARTKGSIFEIVYRRYVPRLGHKQAIGAIAHRQCRLLWLVLHQGVRYEERGEAVTKRSKQKRTAKMIRELRSLGLSGTTCDFTTGGRSRIRAGIFDPVVIPIHCGLITQRSVVQISLQPSSHLLHGRRLGETSALVTEWSQNCGHLDRLSC
jgi:Transposase IS116/IS110/IS902 family